MVFSDGICSPGGALSFWSGSGPSLYGVVFLGILTTHLFVALLKMIATGLNYEKANSVFAHELSQTIVSILVFLFTVLILNYFCVTPAHVLFSGLPSTETGNIYQTSISYFSSVLGEIRTLIFAIYFLITSLVTFFNVDYTVTPMGIGAVFNPYAWFSSIEFILDHISFLLILNMFVFSIQRYMIYFGFYGLLGFYLPLGLVLRSFAPTRLFGGGLIGMSLAFGVIYPLMVNLSYMSLYSFRHASVGNLPGIQLINTSTGAPISNFDVLTPDKAVAVASSLRTQEELIIHNSQNPAFQDSFSNKKINEISNPDIYDQNGNLKFFKFKNLYSISGIAIGALLLPTSYITLASILMTGLSFIILGTSSIELSKLLGEEIDITNLTRVI